MNVQRDSCCYCCSSSYLFHICTYKANVQFFHTIDLCRCHFVFSRTFFFAITFISYRKLWYRCKNVLPRPTEFWFETACCLLRIKNIKWNEIWIRFGAGIFQCTMHTFGFYHCVFHEMHIGTVVMNHTAKNDRWFKTNWKPEKQLCSVPLTTLHRACFHLSLWLNSHMFDHLVLFKPEKTIAPETLHSNENRRSMDWPLQCSMDIICSRFTTWFPPLTHHL